MNIQIQLKHLLVVFLCFMAWRFGEAAIADVEKVGDVFAFILFGFGGSITGVIVILLNIRE